MDHPVQQPHDAGETSGSPQRAAQQLSGAWLAFDLAAEAAQLRYERGYQEGDRNANTLVKAPNFRIVLTALRAGARLQAHQTAGAVAIQTVQGQLLLHVGGVQVDLPTGHLLALEPGVAHDVEAAGDSVFLLTIGWHGADGPGT
jgi:quercetin dioxygenase-like cupin family protein